MTTLISVFMHSSATLHVHLLHDDTLSPETCATLSPLCREYQHRLTLPPITLSPAMAAINTRQFSVATLYRLVLPQLLRDLDADLVKAIDSDPHQHPVSAVLDDLISGQASGRQELAMLGIPASHCFNAGLLGLRPTAHRPGLGGGAAAVHVALPRGGVHRAGLAQPNLCPARALVPMRYLQQMHARPGSALLIPTR